MHTPTKAMEGRLTPRVFVPSRVLPVTSSREKESNHNHTTHTSWRLEFFNRSENATVMVEIDRHKVLDINETCLEVPLLQELQLAPSRPWN